MWRLLCITALWLMTAAPSQTPAPPENTPIALPVAGTDSAAASVDAKPHVVRVLAPKPDAEIVSTVDALMTRDVDTSVLDILGNLDTPAANLLRARVLRLTGSYDEAKAALARLQSSAQLVDEAAVEHGLCALACGDIALATQILLPLIESERPVALPAVDTFAMTLAAQDAPAFVDHHDAIARMMRRRGTDARSQFLGWYSQALRQMGREDEALVVDKQRYLEEPVSLLTPETPPAVELTTDDRLARVEVLQNAHRSERVTKELREIGDRGLTSAQRCQKSLGLGLAWRKLREYAKAEEELTRATVACKDDDERQRRAFYLQAKVISIRDGLRAIDHIDAFAKRYPSSSMVDDVLFWAGDVFQRRARNKKARAYYRRIGELANNDDYCAEALWRLGWMSYRAKSFKTAKRELLAMLASDCSMPGADRARGHYWLGRIANEKGDTKAAIPEYRQAFAHDALGFYAQLAITRLRALDPSAADSLAKANTGNASTEPPLSDCETAFLNETAPMHARALLAYGLKNDAKRALLAIAPAAVEVLSSTHASAVGVNAKHATSDPQVIKQCERERRFSLAMLLDAAGANQEAHWRLRTEFATELTTLPTAVTLPLWHAAYPLAFAQEISAAEHEHMLPDLLLQALAREESAFDAEVVSWAGAYGLTQLLLSTARDAGKLLKPKVTLERAEELMDPAKNALLGGAFLAALLRRYNGSAALALAGYNAGIDAANAWQKRHANEGVDVLAEEITIQETRGYVKRVLRTFGVYRWLYRGELPGLGLGQAAPRLTSRTTDTSRTEIPHSPR